MQVVFSIVVLWVATHFTRQAKAQATNGIISGTVIDASGAAVPGVTIQVKNVNTGVTRTVLTNEQGRYRVPDLLVGAYEVQGALPGFQTVVQRGIPLTVGSERVVDFSLQVGQPETTVTVEGEIAQVDTTSTAIASLIEQKQIADLPLNGRNYTQLIALAPGVQQAAPGTSGFYGRGANFSVAGARPEGQAFLLDNTNVQDFWNHGPGSAVLGTTLGVEAIGEFSTQTNTYGAQFGGAGAAINAVTRSGTNQFHGSVFEYFRNSVLDARGPFDGPKLPTFRQNQFGASLGGPIRKDKTFFFANYEGLRRGLGLTRVTFVPDANAHNGILPGLNPIPLSPLIQQLLTYYPIPNNSIGGGLGRYSVVATQAGNEDYILGRVDHMISATDSVFGRYIRDRADFTDPFSGSNLPLWPETHRTGNHYATIEERHIVSSAVVNLARFSFVRTREGSNLNDNLPGLSFYPNRKNGTISVAAGTTISGSVAPLGSSIFLPFQIVQNKFSGADDVYWTHGLHNLRIGGYVERVQSNVNAPGWFGGNWSFSSLENFLRGNPSVFLGPLPGQEDAYRDFREIDAVGYVQDEWRVRPKLTLNLGLRYNFVSNPVTVKHPLNAITDFVKGTGFVQVPNVFKNNPSLRNFDPRFGFAYDPFNDHKTSIRGGFGVFHNPVQPRTYASAYYFNPPYVLGTVIAPSFPSPFASLTAPLPSQTNGVNYDTPSTPYLMQWNLNLQRQVMEATILTVGYVGSRGAHLFNQRDQNPPIPAIGPTGERIYGTLGPTGVVVPNRRRNTAFGPLNSAEPTANSIYNSLQANLNRRFQRNVQAQVSYTWSHCTDNSSSTYGLEGGLPILDPYDAARDRGNCLFDRRHSLVISSLVALPFKGAFAGHQLIEGWQLTGIWNVRTGPPLNILTGFDQSGLGLSTNHNRPSLKPGRTWDDIKIGKLNRWFDPTAFTLQPVGTIGNLGRNVFFGPGFSNIDFSAMKNTRLKEQLNLQFRAEFYNLLNHPNWGLPNVNVFTQAANGGGNYSPAAGTITSLAAPQRQIQFALKMIF